MARRSKYEPARVAKIIDAINLGATYELAAGYAGISPDTLTAWKDRYPDFSDMLREAEGRAATKWLAKIERAADIDWKAAAWKLERRHPTQYGKQSEPTNVNVTINMREAAERIAAENGIDPADLIAEAEHILTIARSSS